MADATVSARGAQRWAKGHPWIFRSDLVRAPDAPPGVVRVGDQRGQPLGVALWSPASEIALRMLDRDATARVDAAWWRRRLEAALARRPGLDAVATAYRLVHGEADGMPSLVVDRYDRWLVVQLLSAGLEACRADLLAALAATVPSAGILARNDAPVRAREGLARTVDLLAGEVPDEVEIVEHGVRTVAALRTGQKTGAFLDQRENRALVAAHAGGRALDCFSYHGAFALHLARGAHEVTAVDASAPAIARAADHAARNGVPHLQGVVADVFEFLRAAEGRGDRWDRIVLDPPAFAKSRATVDAAVRGYKEINLRALRLLAPGGLLFTFSCSYHVARARFVEMVRDAAADSGRRVLLRAVVGQPVDHPEVLTIPETGYLKGVVVEVGA
jgi:23S rRNA (cytosine1962-C5)-methyltransferase